MTELPKASPSTIQTLLSQGPLACWAGHRLMGNIQKAPSDSKIKGRLAHAALLGEAHDLAPLPFDAFRSNEAKAARDAALEEGLIPVTQTKLDATLPNAQRVHEQLERYGVSLDGHTEVLLEWEEQTSIGQTCHCKGYADVIQPDQKRIIELKTADSVWTIPTAVRHLSDSHSLLQEPAYRRGAEAVYEIPAHEWEVLYLFVQMEPPFSILPGTLAGDFREMAEIRWMRGITEFAERLWRGTERKYWEPSTEPQVLTAPGWLLARELEIEAMGEVDAG